MADITDPRIAAIMAKLQGKPSPDEQSPAEEEKEEEVIKAPKTLEEFIELEKLVNMSLVLQPEEEHNVFI